MPDPFPPPRPPGEVAAVAASLREQGQCCPHPKGAHGPDGGCRMCAVHGGRACTGWSPAWFHVTSRAYYADRLGNTHLIGVEDTDALPCSTVGCEHRADRHFPDEAQPSGLGPCRVDGCSCGRWTYIIAGSEEDVLRRAGVIAGAMAGAIGAATPENDDTVARALALLRAHRADLEVILAVPDDDGCAKCGPWMVCHGHHDDVVDAEVGSSGDPLLDLVHDVLTRHLPPDVGGWWVRARDELTDAVRAAAQVRWS